MFNDLSWATWDGTYIRLTGWGSGPPQTRSRTRQSFELVHIIGPVQNFGPPARNFGPLRAEFAWREWRKTLGGHVANWAGLSGFSHRENKISHNFFIDCINRYSKVSNAHNSHDCHGVFNRSRTRQNFELVHIIGPVQNFGPPARNFGPLRAEFAWREWRETLGGHVAIWAGLSGFSPRENKISHTFFIDFINKYSKVSNAHNSDDCHGVFNGGMLNKGWSFSRSRFDCLGLMHFFHG